MRRLWLFAILVAANAICALAGDTSRKRYDSHVVVRVVPRTTKQLQTARDFQMAVDTSVAGMSLWRRTDGVGRPMDLQLPRDVLQETMGKLRSLGLEHFLMIEDVQKAIDETLPKKRGKTVVGDFDYGEYHEIEEINDWLTQTVSSYKEMASLFTVGETFEGRVVYGLKVQSTSMPKKAIWIEGGIHAREWITSATVIYIANQLLKQYNTNDDVKTVVDSLTWYIVPVVNVDGYKYTWTTDRMWRKTRSRYNGTSCVGTDPNRNWDFHWSESGASTDPCKEEYCGPRPFSEPCVASVANYLATIAQNTVAFIDFHSYGQLWMTPWGYTKDLPPAYADQENSSIAAVQALAKLYGTQYQYGTIANIIYIASGSSADWTYGHVDIKYSAGVELRDNGTYGFLLPASQIIPSGEETLQGLLAFCLYILDHF